MATKGSRSSTGTAALEVAWQDIPSLPRRMVKLNCNLKTHLKVSYGFTWFDMVWHSLTRFTWLRCPVHAILMAKFWATGWTKLKEKLYEKLVAMWPCKLYKRLIQPWAWHATCTILKIAWRIVFHGRKWMWLIHIYSLFHSIYPMGKIQWQSYQESSNWSWDVPKVGCNYWPWYSSDF